MGLNDLACRATSLDESELRTELQGLDARGLLGEWTELAADMARGEDATAEALAEEMPSEAAAARHRADAWRAIRRRIDELTRPTEAATPAWAARLVAEVRDLRAQIETLLAQAGPAQKDVLDRDEAAAFLGVSRRTVDRLISGGVIRAKAIKTQGRRGAVRIARAELERYLAGG